MSFDELFPDIKVFQLPAARVPEGLQEEERMAMVPLMPELLDRARQEGEIIWTTNELTADYDVIAFAAPYVEVVSRISGKHYRFMFTHFPRYYFYPELLDDQGSQRPDSTQAQAPSPTATTDG